MNYLKTTLFLIICLTPQNSFTQFHESFITDYFLLKRLSSVIVYHCSEPTDTLQLFRQLSELQIKSVFRTFEMKVENEWPYFINSTHSRIGLSFDLHCQKNDLFQVMLNKVSDYRMLDEIFNWLIIATDLKEILESIDNKPFGISTDFVIAIKKRNGYTLYDIYNPCKKCGSKLNVTKIGNWNWKYGFDFTLGFSKSNRWNLCGSKLKLSGLISHKPEDITVMDYLEDYNRKHLDPIAKFSYALWMALSEMFNFSILYQGKTVWKKGDKNGPVMNDIINGEADGTGSPLTMTHERLRIGHPVYPAIPFRSCFFFRSVPSTQLNYKLLFEPFSSEVWHYIVLFSIFSVNVVVLLSFFQQSKLSHKYVNAFILNLSAFCQQGVDYTNGHLSGRIALLFIFVFNLLINNYYMASLVSTRLRNYHIKINDSLNQLTKVKLDFASEKSLYFDFYMKRNDWETKSFYSNVWTKIPDDKKFLDPNQALSLVAKGGFAYHTLPETAYPHIERFFDERKICEMTEVHLVRPTQLAFFVPKNSSFTEMMKCGFAKLTEDGVRNREVLRWLARKPKCRLDVLTTEKVTFDETAPLIIFMISSMVLSFGLLIFEKVFFLKL